MKAGKTPAFAFPCKVKMGSSEISDTENERVRVASVALAAPLDRPLSYLVPPELDARLQIGMRVLVPLGRRRVVGYVLELGQGQGRAEGLKPLAEVLGTEPLFSAGMIPFFLRAAEYYCYPPGEVIRTALPAGLSDPQGGAAQLRERFYQTTGVYEVPTGKVQREILEWITSQGEVSLTRLRERFDAPHAPLNRLVELGFLTQSEREKLRDPFLSQPVVPDRPFTPTQEQSAALGILDAALRARTFSPHLLHGVTGSGKTEVYLQAIEGALSLGKKALVLVPEIALTPQLVARFRARFTETGKVIAVLHSGLSDGERYDAWRVIARGGADIVIGARSAVFAPVQGLGIIVVDEEHEAGYKQSEGFRYHARDLALLRAQMEQAVVVLGSATPSVTTCYRALQGQTGYLRLTQRAGNSTLPPVELIDLREQVMEGALSPPLQMALEKTLQAGEQALFLLNRRGFSPYILCADCGTTFRCPNCEITLTFHQGRRLLRCHYCDYAEQPPEKCPTCFGLDIRPEGTGTERLEEELVALCPQARIARMDRDTTARKGAHRQLMEQMLAGQIDILVGTQMVAKGHDFPGVTLVGVVGADSTLNFPDFRSAERTFALLSQVAGRAGRGGRAGRVLIQTFSPDHYALCSAAVHDYEGFYAQEIEFRRELAYPPFGFLVNLVLSGNDAKKVAEAAESMAAGLEKGADEVEVLGPAPCPLGKLRGKTRVQILLKSPQRSALRKRLQALPALRRKVPTGVSLVVDIDPVDML